MIALQLGTREKMQEEAQKFADVLGATIVNTYSLLNDLTENANLFFMEANAVAGKQAQADAIALGDVTKTFNFEE